MGYKVIEGFSDMTDGGYEYHAGDIFPRSGLIPSEGRIRVLSTTANALGRPLIVGNASSLPKETPKEENTGETTVERPKGKGKARKG